MKQIIMWKLELYPVARKPGASSEHVPHPRAEGTGVFIHQFSFIFEECQEVGHINFPAPEDHSACCWAHCPQSPPEKAHRQWEASPLCPTVGRLKAPGQVTCIISYRSTDVRLCTYSHSQAALVTSESSKIHISIFKIFISTLTEGYSTLCISVDSGTSI